MNDIWALIFAICIFTQSVHPLGFPDDDGEWKQDLSHLTMLKDFPAPSIISNREKRTYENEQPELSKFDYPTSKFTAIPETCEAVHTVVVARHGSR